MTDGAAESGAHHRASACAVIASAPRPGVETGFGDMNASILHAAETIKGGLGAYLRDLFVVQRESFGAGVVTALVPARQRTIVQSPEGVEIHTFDDSGPRLLNTCRLAWRMRQVVARKNPDVVHLHSTFAGAALRPLLRILRSPASVIYCAHGWSFDRHMPSLARHMAQSLERSLSSWCDAIVCISRHEMLLAEGIGIPVGAERSTTAERTS